MRGCGAAVTLVFFAFGVVDSAAESRIPLRPPPDIEALTTNPGTLLPTPSSPFFNPSLLATPSHSTGPSPPKSTVQASTVAHDSHHDQDERLPLTVGQVGIIVGIAASTVFIALVGIFLRLITGNWGGPWRRNSQVDIESPVVGKEAMMGLDPFITDAQARGMGCDLSRQPTRRIEAKFALKDQLGVSKSHKKPPPILLMPMRSDVSVDSSCALSDDESSEAYDTGLPVLGRNAPPSHAVGGTVDVPSPRASLMQNLISQLEPHHPTQRSIPTPPPALGRELDGRFTAL